MATNTANGKYSYDTIYYGKPLCEWVDLNHAENCRVNGWSHTSLLPGAFGFDNLACSLVHLFNEVTPNSTDVELASAVHNGWAENYTFWRDTKPWLGPGKGVYFKASKPLGDVERDTLVVTPYSELPLDEQTKYMVFVTFCRPLIVC
jgi:hypothetical protein